MRKNFVLAIYDCEEKLLAAAHKAKEKKAQVASRKTATKKQQKAKRKSLFLRLRKRRRGAKMDSPSVWATLRRAPSDPPPAGSSAPLLPLLAALSCFFLVFFGFFLEIV